MSPPRILFPTFFPRLRANPSVRQIGVIAKWFVFGHLFTSYIGRIGCTEGVSMVPSIPHSYGSIFLPRIVESRLHRRGRNIKVGDIITFTHPVKSATRASKRVIGMPGDFVTTMTPGRRDEDLGKKDDEGEWAKVREELVRVPEGHCWVAGDNLDWSRDSRMYGAVPLALVRGKVLGVVWPLSEARWFGDEFGDFGGSSHEWITK